MSLFRFKVWYGRYQKEQGKLNQQQIRELDKLEKAYYRANGQIDYTAPMNTYWQNWLDYYKNDTRTRPRGDALLTEFTLRAMKALQPRLMMINYNDPDYVHWGNKNHYYRGIKIIDNGIKRLCEYVEKDPFYKDNTVFIAVPDCGRDSSSFAYCPFQHHFNSRSSHEIFAMLWGKGIPQNKIERSQVNQINVAATVAAIMGFESKEAEGDALKI